jgi:hypothetical protein
MLDLNDNVRQLVYFRGQKRVQFKVRNPNVAVHSIAVTHETLNAVKNGFLSSLELIFSLARDFLQRRLERSHKVRNGGVIILHATRRVTVTRWSGLSILDVEQVPGHGRRENLLAYFAIKLFVPLAWVLLCDELL